MSKHLKKIISVFLVVLMLTGSAPLDGFKGIDFDFIPELNLSLPEIDFNLFSLKSRALEENGFTYTAIDDTYCTITKYTGTDTEIIVPSELGGYIVQKIGSNAFYYNNSITSIVLPDTITIINESAFSGCTALVNVEMQEGITTINNYAFSGCTSLENLILPDSITNLSYCIFAGCTKLISINYPKNLKSSAMHYGEMMGPFAQSYIETVIIPDGIVKIPDYTFSYCKSLKTVKLPDSLTEIGSYAFRSCSSLEELILPDSITTIGSNAFSNTVLLKKINYPMMLKSGNLASASYIESVTIPDGTTIITDSAFEGCNIKEIIIPDSVTSIGRYAFSNCKFLEKIELNEGLLSIGHYAFQNCNLIEKIELNEGLLSIGHYAFQNCNLIENITLPDSITTLGSNLFFGCEKLTSINYPANLETCELISYTSGQWTSYYYEGPFADSYLSEIVVPEGVEKIVQYSFAKTDSSVSIIFPDSLKIIEPYAFYDSDFSSIELPDSIEDIGSEAFASCDKLISVKLPENLTTISFQAFSSCQALNEVIFNDSLVFIGEYAFQYCTNLTSVQLPDSVKTIERSAFANCTNLVSINYPLNIEVCTNPFAGSGLREVTIPDGVTTIATYSFYGCKNLERVVMSNSVTKINNNAFENCSSLTDVVFSENLKSIGQYAFRGCSSITSFDLPQNLTYIGCMAFANCISLENIILPDSLIHIQYQLFDNCPKLTTINYPKNLTTVTGYNGSNRQYFGPFTNSSITKVIVPEDTKKIAERAFWFHKTLKEIELPEGLQSIGSKAFEGCGALTELTIPQSVTDFNYYCILNCYHTTVYCYYNSVAHNALKNTSYKYELLFDHEHDVIEITAIAPTCTLPGKKTLTCSICGYVTTDDAPALGHSFSDWTEIKKPTVLTEGKMSRTCSVCSEVETKITDRVTIDIENTNEYGIANFTVVNAQTLAPVKNANIFISTAKDGESTFYTDEEGKVSIVLPVGENVITAHAKGLISRTLTIDIVHGMNEIPAIGLGSSPIVEAELITTPMTKEEIEDAGIDTTAPGNNNVIKYEVTFEFTAKDDEPKKETVTETFYVNSNGEHFYQNNNQSSTHEIFGKPVTIYPTERFYLIITGDIIWLKEMFHVQLYAYNNSNTDWIEDVVATLNLPEGLSLADMIEGEQTLSQQIGKIAEGGQADCEWYIRGDKEGVYDITATLDGRIMPFNEEFSNEYTAESAIKVYSGKGMSLSFEVPSTTYCGDEYPVKIILKNISDKPIYNVAHILTGIQQSKVTHYSNGEVVEELYVKDALNASKFVEEFKAGDEIVIEVTAEILFKSEQYKDCFFELVDIILGAKELGEAINNNFGFPTEHDWSEWETVKEATCGETGQEKRICKNNSEHIEYRDVEKLPHNWDNGVIDPASTCNTHGTKTYTCQNDASHTKTEVVPLDANNHFGDTYIKDEKDATCIEDGYTGDTYCADCDAKLEDGEVIPTPGHDYVGTTTAPSCTEKGYTTYTCSVCGDTYIDNYVNATGHTWGNWTTVKEPTYTEMGEEKRVCSKGDAEETRPIPVLTRPSDDNENIETEKTVEYDSATGEAVIKLVASSKGEKITVNSRTPLDIVLVLDQSGSMEGDLLKKLKTATEDFTNAIYQDAVNNNIDHRIAMVGFAMQNQYNFGSEYPQYLNTEILTTGGAPVKYNSLSTAKMNEVYRNALVSVNVDGTLNPVLTLAKNNLEAKGATAADLGLDMACQIFAQNENDGSRKRIVVFMTDGVPTYKSDYMEETATNATTKANLLKDAYDADLYSVGVLSGSNTNKAKTFLNNIASKDENNKALYFDCADADKLVEDFQTIATQSTTVTTDFADITLIDTVSSAFTLTAVQENELRKNAIEKLGITNDDITVTRYADGTTEVKLEHINPVAISDGDDINYVIDIDFRVTANEKALIAGSYGTNTDNAGVLIGTTDVYENNFAVPGATVENAEGVIYFTVNGIVYHVVRVHKGDTPEAPEFTLDGEYTFSGWNIPDEVVFDGGKLTVDATLTQKEYTVTWNTADGTMTDSYYAGDVIVIPEVGLNAKGDEVIGWNTVVPVTMPAENLEFTAIYGKHVHSYTEKVLKKVSCGIVGKVQYICSCGDSYMETVEALSHKWATSATSTDGTDTAYSHVYCENCGASPDKTLEYTIKGTTGWNNKVTYDLKLTDAENITVQPDGEITISLPVPQNMKNARNITIYREEADGTLTNLNGTVKNGYITFTTTHFSIYIIDAEYECAETGNHTDEDTDNICDICGNEIPVEEPSENCNHYCHQKGFMNFLWKIINFLYRLFGIEEKHFCACGVAHW